jgi:hypothetical protein
MLSFAILSRQDFHCLPYSLFCIDSFKKPIYSRFLVALHFSLEGFDLRGQPLDFSSGVGWNFRLLAHFFLGLNQSHRTG